MFKKLNNCSYEENEKQIIDYWSSNKIFEKSVNNEKKNYVFYDGPAFANGFPGLHHIVAKNLKDTVCKYQTMKGHSIVRKIGWDTHGLPIENHVEKKLGFKSKKDIENFGIDNFNKECRKSIRENESAFTDLTHKMGQFIDTDNPYLTFKNEYIETEWWILKQFFDKGYFYEGTKVTPYCPRCGTALASHEVAQGYKSVDVDTVIVPMKLKNKNEYFLVWTTTPWTLLSNVALCVNPDEDYVKVESKGNIFILAKALINNVFEDDVNVLDSFKGKTLEYTEYEQLIPEIKLNKRAFYVTCDSYVTMEDGTGIVHIAPAFGEDDALVGKKYDLPLVNPVGLDGKYTTGPWKDMVVFDADKDVIKYLKENGKLFKKIRITHDYPHCWRCDSPLLYYTLPSYYIAVSKFSDKLVEANSKVNWYPDYVGTKRFNNWLMNAKDWAVSRTRYWGSPIPYYKCSCGNTHMLGSINELKEMAVEKINDDLDLHKPYIDNIHIKCPKCGEKMTRIPDVLDCWFDSGSMPFAQYHYPFENKDFFETQFPADFICEGIDQTRGWFYTLLVISTFIKGCSPYKNVLVNDLLLDKDGKKMSKSRGNIVEPFTAIREYGADAVRWYLLYVSPIWTPTKFDMNGLKDINSKFFSTLKNTYTFFEIYANTDNVDPRNYDVSYYHLEVIDKWLLSKYNNLVKNVTFEMDRYDLNKTVHYIQDFVVNDLSNWYIRRNRRRFWGSELDNSKKAVYKTTYDVLLGISKLIAPMCPFVSEELYRNLTDGESVHLVSYPVSDEKLIDNELEKRMDNVIDIISIARNLREEAKIKVRQPINDVIIEEKYKESLFEFEDLMKEELNTKNIVWANNMNDFVSVSYKPNFKEVGKMLGSNLNKFTSIINSLSDDDKVKLDNSELTIDLDGKFNVKSSYVIKCINAKDGYKATMLNYKIVAINTLLNDELINEGLAREIVSKIQNLRKTLDFDVADRIIVNYECDEKLDKAINSFKKYIMDETLCVLFEKGSASELVKINDFDLRVSIVKK